MEVKVAVIRLEMLDPIIQSHFFIAISGDATKLTKDTIIFMLLQIFQKSFFNTFSKLTFMLNLGNKFFCNQRSRMSNENSTLRAHLKSWLAVFADNVTIFTLINGDFSWNLNADWTFNVFSHIFWKIHFLVFLLKCWTRLNTNTACVASCVNEFTNAIGKKDKKSQNLFLLQILIKSVLQSLQSSRNRSVDVPNQHD